MTLATPYVADATNPVLDAAVHAGQARDALVYAAMHLAGEVRAAGVSDEAVCDALVVLVLCAEASADAQRELAWRISEASS